MKIEQQEKYMELALLESKKAIPACFPNPPVGCVLVKNGEILATGYTQSPGSNHAEAEALSKLSSKEAGISAFVTLEPCSFHGRTPSCAKALANNRISTVYVALKDPDPRNSGRGLDILRSAGIEVIENVYSERVSEFLSRYLQDG